MVNKPLAGGKWWNWESKRMEEQEPDKNHPRLRRRVLATMAFSQPHATTQQEKRQNPEIRLEVLDSWFDRNGWTISVFDFFSQTTFDFDFSSRKMSVFGFVRLYRTLFDFVRLYRTLLDFVRLYRALFEFVLTSSEIFRLYRESTEASWTTTKLGHHLTVSVKSCVKNPNLGSRKI